MITKQEACQPDSTAIHNCTFWLYKIDQSKMFHTIEIGSNIAQSLI